MKAKGLLVLALAGASFGCQFKGAVATFPGVKNPVLLGPKDRIAAKDPLPTETIGEFETEATREMVQSKEGNYDVITESWTGKLKLSKDAIDATKQDPNIDIRLDDVMPAAYAIFSSIKIKSYVSIEGKAVKVTPPKGGKP